MFCYHGEILVIHLNNNCFVNENAKSNTRGLSKVVYDKLPILIKSRTGIFHLSLSTLIELKY